MISPKEINELLEAAKPSIIEGFKKEIKDNISWEVKNKTAKIVAAETEKWVRENIIPEIIKQLTESKEGLIAVGVSIAPKIVEELAKSLTEVLGKKLEEPWGRKKIFEAMFV